MEMLHFESIVHCRALEVKQSAGNNYQTSSRYKVLCNAECKYYEICSVAQKKKKNT